MIRTFLYSLLLACTAVNFAYSQSSPPVLGPVILKLQDQSIFDGKTWIFLPLEGDPLVITKEDPGSHDVRLPTEGLRFGYRSFRNGYFWDIRRIISKEGNKETSRSYLYRQAALTNSPVWEKVGEIDTVYGLTNYLVPLDKEDTFLGIGPFFGYVKDGQASLIAIFKLQKEKLVFQGLTTLPFGASRNIASVETITYPLPPLRPGESPNREPRKLQKCVISPSGLHPDLWLPALLPNHLAMASSKAGVIWLLSLKNGDLHKVIDLGHLDGADMERLGHLDHFLLAAGPDIEGKLIVATRSNDVLLFAKSLYTPPGSPVEVGVENKRRFKEIIKEMTNVQWWAIDAETGNKESLNGQGLFPEHVPFDRQGQLRFLFSPAGKFHLHSPCSWMDLVNNMKLAMPERPREIKDGTGASQTTAETNLKQ